QFHCCRPPRPALGPGAVAPSSPYLKSQASPNIEPIPVAIPAIAKPSARELVHARVPSGEQIKLRMLAADSAIPVSGMSAIAIPADTARLIEVVRIASSLTGSNTAGSGRGRPTTRRIETSTRVAAIRRATRAGAPNDHPGHGPAMALVSFAHTSMRDLPS